MKPKPDGHWHCPQHPYADLGPWSNPPRACQYCEHERTMRRHRRFGIIVASLFALGVALFVARVAFGHEGICFPNGQSAFDDCCHDIHCRPCQIHITPYGIFVDGKIVEVTGLDALRPIKFGADENGVNCVPQEWCCTEYGTDVHHCLFFKSDSDKET